MESNQRCCLLHPKSLCISLVWLSSFEFIRACQRKKPQLLLLQKPTFYHERLLKNHMYVGTNVLWITAFFFIFAHQWTTVRFGDAEMQISVAGCSWGVCFAAIAFSIVPAFCANGIQLTLLSATSKVALHWPGMIVEFRIYQSLGCQRKRPHLLLLQKPTFHNKRLLKNHVYVGTNVLWITACFCFVFAHQWKTVRFGDADMQISVAGAAEEFVLLQLPSQ